MTSCPIWASIFRLHKCTKHIKKANSKQNSYLFRWNFTQNSRIIRPKMAFNLPSLGPIDNPGENSQELLPPASLCLSYQSSFSSAFLKLNQADRITDPYKRKSTGQENRPVEKDQLMTWNNFTHSRLPEAVLSEFAVVTKAACWDPVTRWILRICFSVCCPDISHVSYVMVPHVIRSCERNPKNPPLLGLGYSTAPLVNLNRERKRRKKSQRCRQLEAIVKQAVLIGLSVVATTNSKQQSLCYTKCKDHRFHQFIWFISVCKQKNYLKLQINN